MITRPVINTIIGDLNQTRRSKDRTTIERGLADCVAKVEALLDAFEGSRDATNPAWRVLSEANEHLVAAHKAAGVSQKGTPQRVYNYAARAVRCLLEFYGEYAEGASGLTDTHGGKAHV